MSVETKKTEANKYSLRDASFFNIWRRIFLWLPVLVIWFVINLFID